MCMVLYRPAKFHLNQTIRDSYDVIAIYKTPAVSHVEFRLDRIYSFGDTAIFWHFGIKTAYSCPLLGALGHIVPK